MNDTNDADEEKKNQLLEEHERNRKRLQTIVEDLEGFSEHAKSLIPTSSDFKSKFILAERLDIANRLFENVLRYRSEIAKQLKDEISIIKTISGKDEETDYLDWINKTDVKSDL